MEFIIVLEGVFVPS